MEANAAGPASCSAGRAVSDRSAQRAGAAFPCGLRTDGRRAAPSVWAGGDALGWPHLQLRVGDVLRPLPHHLAGGVQLLRQAEAILRAPNSNGFECG